MMTKREEAKEILRSLGLPKQQYNERSCLTLLSLAGLKEKDAWSDTQRPILRTVDVMQWMAEYYSKRYAPNSRETIRRQTIHQFEQARLINRNPDDPARPTNSGNTNYQLTPEAAEVLRSYGADNFEDECQSFIASHGKLIEAYNRSRQLHKIPVTLPNGSKIRLSPGKHNELQRAIIEEFAPRFAQRSVLLYLGDTARKGLFVADKQLKSLKIPAMKHEKLPDVVLYDRRRGWLFLIEAVTSHGPVSAKRYRELELVLKRCPAQRIYVTAFEDFHSFKQFANEIVWESEVWIAKAPDHLIHFNGEKFLGPYPGDPN